MIAKDKLRDWQRRLAERTIYITVIDNEPQNYYKSEEAAMCEVQWATRHRASGKYLRVERVNVHTLELAKERWS